MPKKWKILPFVPPPKYLGASNNFPVATWARGLGAKAADLLKSMTDAYLYTLQNDRVLNEV